MHNEDARPQFDTSSDGDLEGQPSRQPSPDELIKKADDLCVELISITHGQSKEKEACAQRLVSAIYTLHETFRSCEAAYSMFLKERKVKRGKSTNEYHATAKAVMERHAREGKRPSIALYAQACHVMKSEGVDPSASVQWLNEPGGEGGRDGKGRIGFGKTKQLWTASAEGQAERKKKQNSSEEKAKRHLKEELKMALSESADEAAPSGDTAASGAIGIALIEYDDQGQLKVRRVLNKNPIKTFKALKACESKTGDDQEVAA